LALGLYPVELNIDIQNQDLNINWSPQLGALEYHIFYQEDPYFTPTGAPQAIVHSPDTSWTDVGAINQGKRYYRVVAEY
jgi:hypothetical protein